MEELLPGTGQWAATSWSGPPACEGIGAKMTFEVLAEGLRFPEGPIAMADGSVILVEIARGTLSRV